MQNTPNRAAAGMTPSRDGEVSEGSQQQHKQIQQQQQLQQQQLQQQQLQQQQLHQQQLQLQQLHQQHPHPQQQHNHHPQQQQQLQHPVMGSSGQTYQTPIQVLQELTRLLKGPQTPHLISDVLTILKANPQVMAAFIRQREVQKCHKLQQQQQCSQQPTSQNLADSEADNPNGELLDILSNMTI